MAKDRIPRTPREQRKIELALAALSYLSFNWNDSRAAAEADLEELWNVYSQAEIERGALTALGLILMVQANRQGQDKVAYINSMRPLVDVDLEP